MEKEIFSSSPSINAGGGANSSDLELKVLHWFVSDDIAYYTNHSFLRDYNKEKYPLLISPSFDDVLFNIRKSYTFSVLSPTLPDKKIKSLFIIHYLPNKYGILTTQQYLSNISKDTALEQKLGLSVIKSPFSLKNVGGAYALKAFTKNLLQAEKAGYKAKGIFLVGVPGTGKTFFPKCFAGETDRLLIQLNLTLIMESDEPIRTLNQIFEYLTQRCKEFPNEKYVILIDEIEKMIGNAEAVEKRMLGRLLTVLNDINTEACEYDFNAIFFATANDLSVILDNNPEFLRRGRFDELFFINLPTIEYAIDIFNLYIKKFQIDYIFDILTLDDIIAEIENKYQKDNNIIGRFPYTASEIENLCKRIDFIKKAKGDDFNKDDIFECVEMIIPIVKSAQKGISKMAAQAELFVEI